MELSGPGDRDTALFISCVSGKEETVSSWRLGHLQKHPSSYERKKGKRKLGLTREEQKKSLFSCRRRFILFLSSSKKCNRQIDKTEWEERECVFA